MPEDQATQVVATPESPQGGAPERQAQTRGQEIRTAQPLGEPEVSPSPAPEPKEQPAEQSVVTKDDVGRFLKDDPTVLDEVLKGWKHEDLAKVPAYSAQIQRYQNKLREEEGKKVQEQYRQRLQLQQQATQWRTYLGQLEKSGQLLQAQLTNPQVAQWVEVIRRLDTGELDNLATSAADSLRDVVSKDEEFKDVDWDRLDKEVDPKQPTSLFMGILKQTDEKRRAELERTLPDLVKGLVEQEIAKREGRSDQPTSGNSGTPRAVPQEGKFTREQISQMSQAEYEKNREAIAKALRGQ